MKEERLKAILQIGLFLLSAALPQAALAEEDEREPDYWQNLTREDGEEKKPETKKEPKEKPFVYQLPHDLKPNLEGVSLQVGGGLYGFGLDAGLLTLRWEKVYWDIAKINAFIIGPARGGWFRTNGGVLTGLGYPYSIGNHEIRVGGAIGYQDFYSGGNKKGCLITGPNEYGVEVCRLEKGVVYGTPPGGGAGGKFEFLYMYHFQDNFALEVGLSVYFQVWPLMPIHRVTTESEVTGFCPFSCTPQKATYLYPDPSPVLTVGFRI